MTKALEIIEVELPPPAILHLQCLLRRTRRAARELLFAFFFFFKKTMLPKINVSLSCVTQDYVLEYYFFSP